MGVVPLPEVIWTSSLVGESWSTPAVANMVHRSVVLAADRTGAVQAFEGPTGQLLWRSQADSVITASPRIVGEWVVWASHSGRVWATDIESGAIVWSHERHAIVRATPACVDLDGNGRLELIVADYKDRVACIDAITGVMRWETKLPRVRLAERATRGIVSSPLVADVDGDGVKEVLVGTRAKRFYCLDARTGRLKWFRRFGYCIDMTPSFAWVDGLPLVFTGTGESLSGHGDNALYALDGVTGRSRWARYLGGGIDASPTVILGGEQGACTVAVSTLANASVFGVDCHTGVVRWSHRLGPTGQCVHDSQNVCRPPGEPYLTDNAVCRSYTTPLPVEIAERWSAVIVGSNNGEVLCIDVDNGSVLWSVHTSGSVRGSVVAGELFSGGEYGLVVATGNQVVALAWDEDWRATWNSFKGDGLHGGRVGGPTYPPSSYRRRHVLAVGVRARLSSFVFDVGRYILVKADKMTLSRLGRSRVKYIY